MEITVKELAVLSGRSYKDVRHLVLEGLVLDRLPRNLKINEEDAHHFIGANLKSLIEEKRTLYLNQDFMTKLFNNKQCVNKANWVNGVSVYKNLMIWPEDQIVRCEQAWKRRYDEILNPSQKSIEDGVD